LTKAQLTGIYHESLKDKKVIVIDVLEFDTIPILCKKDYQINSKTILIEGMLYHRSGKSNAENKMNMESMRNIIDRATTKSGEKLISRIYELFKASGFPFVANKVNNSAEQYKKQIDDALMRLGRRSTGNNG
jgi:hypothetical protein